MDLIDIADVEREAILTKRAISTAGAIIKGVFTGLNATIRTTRALAYRVHTHSLVASIDALISAAIHSRKGKLPRTRHGKALSSAESTFRFQTAKDMIYWHCRDFEINRHVVNRKVARST